MKPEYKATLLTVVGQLDFDILESIFRLENDRIEVALAQFHKTSVEWLARNAAHALQGLVEAYPDVTTPIHYKGTLRDLQRLADVATKHHDWVKTLWEGNEFDDLFTLTLLMLLALKTFGEGNEVSA